MNNKNRKIILILLAILFIALLALAVFFRFFNKKIIPAPVNSYQVEFLSDTQKEFYGLEKDTKAQAFYDEEGNLIYKIIKEDSDIISDPVKAGLKAEKE